MTHSYSGGCACGAIRFETTTSPVSEIHCQCRDCQRRSGTGHGSYLTFATRSAMNITGEAKTWRVVGDLGTEKFHAFCPVCGTPVYLTFGGLPDFIAVHAASLDDPSTFKPQNVMFSISSYPWDRMDPSLTAFERMPPR